MDYILRRSKRNKKIKIRVQDGLVYVSAPTYARKYEIDRFVHSQKNWIDTQIKKNPLLQNKDRIQLFEKEYILCFIDMKKCYVDQNIFYLYRDKVLIQTFLKQNFSKYAQMRFDYFCEQLHIHSIHLHYGFYKSKWGSCTPSQRKICLNVNLIFMPLDFIDAILLHEMAHLFYLNHSSDFYKLLCTWMPSYKDVIRRCKDQKIPRLY